MGVTFRWLGTAGIEVNHDGKVILVDPYLSRLSRLDVFFKPLVPQATIINRYLEDIHADVRAIIVGHTHFDHALDIPLMIHSLGCPVYGSKSLDTLLCLSGIPGRVKVCRPQELISIADDISATMIPSSHGLILSRLLLLEGDIDPSATLPLRTHQYRLGTMYSPKITIGETTFVHVGSAGFIEKELEGHTCDVLFICVAGWKKWPLYPLRIIEMLRPECVIPIHYDDFSIAVTPENKNQIRIMRSADLDGFCRSIKTGHGNTEVRVIEPFTPVSF